jgi:acyl CoA:acetate/3-ketoacid CoA transferase
MSSITDCCPECGASLAECHIGDAVCPECGAVVGDGGDVEIADIRPRVTQAGDELCDYVELCPQMGQTVDGCDYCVHEENYCKLLDEWVVDETICPVAARRNAALLRECRDVLGLAAGVPDNTIQIMRQEGLKIEDIEDPMQKLAFTIHSEACEVAGQAENLLERIGE